MSVLYRSDILKRNVSCDGYTSVHNPIVLSSVLPAYGMFHSIQILFYNLERSFCHCIVIRTSLMAQERSIWNVSNSSSIVWFLNSFPRSVWKIWISDRFPSTFLNACFTSSSVLCLPALYPIISLLKDQSVHKYNSSGFLPLRRSNHLPLHCGMAGFEIVGSTHSLL